MALRLIVLLLLASLYPIPYPLDLPQPVQPPISEMCLSVTSYWVWDEQGDMLPGWGGQCNHDCSTVASGHRLPKRVEDYGGGYAACIQDWTMLKGYSTHVVTFGDFSHYCVDNFGDANYREPFYHDYYEQWVVPVDILDPGMHGLECNWTVSRGMAPEY